VTRFTEPLTRFTEPLVQRRARLDSGRLDPAEYRSALVEHVRANDPTVRAFADWRPADILDSAAPRVCTVSYKDTIDVAGYPTRLGIRTGYRVYPEKSAEVARRLSAHGLACVGKAAVTECALGSVRPSRNPVFPHLSASGSSTGSAAAVAAGFTDLSVGTDSGGSLRWPAVYCGVTALRLTPSPGLMDGVHMVSPSMESVGLVARTPADLGWLWRTHRLGPTFGCPASCCTPFVRTGSRLRFGVSTPPGQRLHPEVAALLRRVADALAGRGHHVAELPLAAEWRVRREAWELLSREAYDGFGYLLDRPDVELGEDTVHAIGIGAGVGDDRYSALLDLQRRTVARMTALLTEQVDLLLVPLEAGLPDPAERTYGSVVPDPSTAGEDLTMTVLASFARLPVLALPLGLSSGGSPIGLQVFARPGAEALLVAVGELLADTPIEPIKAQEAS
jgi:aspartyl-tRNA(Asn)/glutamyl-tRNA(Gln) amidotransferase subunit A